MANREVNLSWLKWLGLIITIIALINITILLDIPVLKQIFGFIFLTFVPGFLILYILKLNKLGLLEKIVLSIGISVTFSMLFGLVVNNLLLALGYARPLSTIPLLISFSTATIILAVIAYKRNKGVTLSLTNLNLTTREKALLIVPSLFPLLSIVGMHIMNLTDNNAFLMLLLFLIPACVIFISFFNRKLPEKIYPGIIWLISISLLLMLALRSNHIMGSDVQDLYAVFQLTFHEGHWGLFTSTLQDANLSISLLPTIYQSFMSIDAEYLFKILYPLLFSISPLVVYIISKKYIGSLYSLLASFLFMAQATFLWTTGTSTTSTAILFFALAIMVLLHQDINEFAKKLLFIIFALSCIVSHYSTAYIFFFVLLLTWIGMQIVPRITPRESKTATPPENPKFRFRRGITTTIVALFLVVLFFWYSQITAVPFNIGVGFIRNTFVELNEFFLLEARGSTITAAVGEGISMLPQQIRVAFSWLVVAFIAIGVLWTMARYKRTVAIPKSGYIKPNFLASKFEMEYFVLSLVCSATLVFSVVMPFISTTYSMERVFFQMLAVLSMFFVIGGIVVAKLLRARPHWIVLLVLIPFFMCTTGMMYQVFGVPASMALNSVGREYELWYVHDTDIYSAKWIGEYSKGRGKIFWFTGQGGRILVSQGKVKPIRTIGLSVTRLPEGSKIDGYVYLRYTDITIGRTVSRYLDMLNEKSKIYSNGGSEIYR